MAFSGRTPRISLRKARYLVRLLCRWHPCQTRTQPTFASGRRLRAPHISKNTSTFWNTTSIISSVFICEVLLTSHFICSFVCKTAINSDWHYVSRGTSTGAMSAKAPRQTSLLEDIVGSVPHINPKTRYQFLPQQKFVSCVSVCGKRYSHHSLLLFRA